MPAIAQNSMALKFAERAWRPNVAKPKTSTRVIKDSEAAFNSASSDHVLLIKPVNPDLQSLIIKEFWIW